MTTFKHSSWEKHFVLSPQKISVLAIENKTDLWKCTIELLNQSEGESGAFCIAKDYSAQSLNKMCIVEANVATLSINTKKIQTVLIKKCVENSSSPEFEEQLRKISFNLYSFCKSVCQDTGYSIELDEEIDVAGLFKLFSLSLKENYKTLLEKLIEYVNVNTEFFKTKIFIFLFLTKFLPQTELQVFFEHCRYQDISLVLIEESFPNVLLGEKIPYYGLIIDEDRFEIEKSAPLD